MLDDVASNSFCYYVVFDCKTCSEDEFTSGRPYQSAPTMRSPNASSTTITAPAAMAANHMFIAACGAALRARYPSDSSGVKRPDRVVSH